MNRRDVDVDALFDRDADTQLLDRRRREELGLARPVAPVSSTPVHFGAESMLGGDVPPAPRPAVLRVALDARPDRGLIPGAVVTLVASVHDDGDADAADVLLRLAIPPEFEPMPDSFARDGVALDGEALLGEGLRLGTITAGDAARVRLALRVLPGTGPLDVSAHAAAAPGIAVLAAPALRLTRRAGHAAYAEPRPFYELETGETVDDLDAVPAAAPEPLHAVDTTLDEPAIPAVPAPEAVVPAIAPDVHAPVDAPAAPEPDVIEAVAMPEPEPEPPEPETEPEPHPDPKPAPPPLKPPTTRPPTPPPPEPASKRVAKRKPKPKPEPEPVRAAPPVPAYLLARMLDAEEVRALDRLFGGAVPHGLGALALLSSIATTDTPLAGALGVREFARAVAAALPRALVAARVSRPVPAVVTREALEPIRAKATAPPDAFAHDGALLVTRLDERELAALRTVLGREVDDPFQRGVQVLLALAPRALEGVPAAAAARAKYALAAYRTAVGAWLMRVTVRRAVDRRFDALTAADTSLYDAGRALVTALRSAVA